MIKDSKKFESNGFLFLKGPICQHVYDDDTDYLISPENLFYYLFGINERNVWGFINLENGKSTIVVDVPDLKDQVWEKLKSLDEYEKSYEID